MNKTNDKLLLVSGCPRSGTTLINFILNSHPEIVITNEIDLVNMADQLRRTMFSKNEKFKKNKISRARSNVESWSLGNFKEFIPSDHKLVPEILKLFCQSIKESESTLIYGDKTPTYYLYDPDLLTQLSPTGTIFVIHVTRNPSDVIRSIMRRTVNSLKGKDYWKSVVTKSDGISLWVKAWNARSKFKQHLGINFLDLNYDALVQDPDAGYKLIADFLGVEINFDASIINSSGLSNKSTTALDFRGRSKLGYYSSIWPEMPLNLSDYTEILPLEKDSFWNKVKRKILVSLIRLQRDN